MLINFTKKEADVIRHRMEVPDAMADVFCPELGDGNPWGLSDHSEIEDKICAIITEVFSDGPRGGMIANFDPENPDHGIICRELLEGSVMGSIARDLFEFDAGEPEHREGKGWLRAIASVEAKFASAGLEAYVPG